MASDAVADLVQRTLAGEREAFGDLVRLHERLVFGLAFQRVRHHALAEDVAQESLIRAYRTLGRLKEPRLFSGWLCGITVNVAREALRRRGGREVALEAAGEPAAPPPTGEAEQAERVLALADNLPEKYRVPLQLHYLGGLRYAEVGQALGVPETTARSLVFRARSLLAERFYQSRDK